MTNEDLEATFHDANCRAVIREILSRSHRDPDFRFELIWNTEVLLSQIPGGCPRELAGVVFRENSTQNPSGIELDPMKKRIYLAPPRWHRPLNRKKLQEMIDRGEGSL